MLAENFDNVLKSKNTLLETDEIISLWSIADISKLPNNKNLLDNNADDSINGLINEHGLATNIKFGDPIAEVVWIYAVFNIKDINTMEKYDSIVKNIKEVFESNNILIE